jgi:nicotinamidase-related amidase
LRLVLRTYQRQPEPGIPAEEVNFHYEEWPVVIPVRQAALVLVDVWDTHHIDSHAARTAEITRTRIAPAVAAARRAGVVLVHAPSPAQARRYPQWHRYATEDDERAPETGDTWLGVPATGADGGEWPPRAFRRREGEYAQFRRPQSSLMARVAAERRERRIDPAVEPDPDDFVVATGNQLHQLCAGRGILHLFYAGFAANVCIPLKDYGVRAFHARGYNVVLLRDCTTAIEGHDTIADLAGTRQAIRELEMAGVVSTITSAAFIRTCRLVEPVASGRGSD